MEMNRIFAWLRPNDLVWNYWVNNYLMGNAPPVFDILYWSNDSTRLPGAFHGELIDIFADNLSCEAWGDEGAWHADRSVAKSPATRCSSPARLIISRRGRTFTIPREAFGGKTEFILSNSGHIQSLINPPGNLKSKFFLRIQSSVRQPDDWLKEAKPMSGSWWELWRTWASDRSGSMRPAPKALGNKRHKPMDKAPGSYVLEP